jgi:hypothetical protein
MLEGGISSIEIGMRSSMNTTSVLGFPLLECKGMIGLMGMPISVDGYCSTVSIIDLPGVNGGWSSPFFIEAST